MAKKKLTEEQENKIKILQANNEMLEKSKEEALIKSTDKKTVMRIEMAQDDIIEQIKQIDVDIAKETLNKSKRKDEEEVEDLLNYSDSEESIFDILSKNSKQNRVEIVASEPTQTIIEEKISYKATEKAYNNVNMDLQYDIIPLPSHGEGYKHKIDRVPVAYLTAYDENFITSPNLYKDGLVIDFLLKNKIMNKDIDINELYRGDVDAIILWLRATSYGVEFPISVTDPKSGEEIETTIDLSTIKTKEFNLKGDEDGYFSYELPLSKDIVKFKFLTRKEEKNLELLTSLENDAVRASVLISTIKTMKNALRVDTLLTSKEKGEMKNVIDGLNVWVNRLSKSDKISFNKLITNKMEMSIVAINDNFDKEFVRTYINNMKAKDSLMLRRYMLENEPGMNFDITIERPERLGGGSFTTFLEWDDSIFLNIA